MTVALDEQRQLTGSISQQRMQQMIQSQSFGGQGYHCISDAEGRVIISPTSLEPFLKLDELFVEKRDAQVVADIEQMQARMRSGERGVLQFVARDQTELVLSYIPIHNGQWVLLTLVPAALMSREVDLYAFWNYIVLALLLIFLRSDFDAQPVPQLETSPAVRRDRIYGSFDPGAERFRIPAVMSPAAGYAGLESVVDCFYQPQTF